MSPEAEVHADSATTTEPAETPESAVTTEEGEKLLDLLEKGNCLTCPYFRPYDEMVGWWGMVGRCNALQGLADRKRWLPFPWQKISRQILSWIAWDQMTENCPYRGRAEAKEIPYDYGEKDKYHDNNH